MTTCIGIDLGGTKIAAAAVDLSSGAVLGQRVVPTEAHGGPEAVIARMAALVDQVRQAAGLAPAGITALGVGVPGVVDHVRGHTLFLPNLPTAWRQVPVAALLQQQTGYPTAIINDARAFTLAEATQGAGKGAHTVVGITVGTGIGGGIAIGGQLHLGIDMSAGEIGHHTIDINGPPCGCGNNGCLEALASGPAIATLGMRAVAQGRTTRIADLVERDLNRVTPEIIMRAAEQDDPIACEILERAGSYLGTGVSNLITILSPDCVVIGGGVAQLGEWLMEPLRATIRRRCFVTPLERVRVATAVLGSEAGIIGAAVWAAQQ